VETKVKRHQVEPQNFMIIYTKFIPLSIQPKIPKLLKRQQMLWEGKPEFLGEWKVPITF